MTPPSSLKASPWEYCQVIGRGGDDNIVRTSASQTRESRPRFRGGLQGRIDFVIHLLLAVQAVKPRSRNERTAHYCNPVKSLMYRHHRLPSSPKPRPKTAFSRPVRP